jgi:hypothetical protein
VSAVVPRTDARVVRLSAGGLSPPTERCADVAVLGHGELPGHRATGRQKGGARLSGAYFPQERRQHGH